MGTHNHIRTKPALASGFVASLLISGRSWHYTVCTGCGQKLFYTYVGETCPYCAVEVTVFVEGEVPPLNRMAQACLAAQESRVSRGPASGTGGGVAPRPACRPDARRRGSRPPA